MLAIGLLTQGALADSARLQELERKLHTYQQEQTRIERRLADLRSDSKSYFTRLFGDLKKIQADIQEQERRLSDIRSNIDWVTAEQVKIDTGPQGLSAPKAPAGKGTLKVPMWGWMFPEGEGITYRIECVYATGPTTRSAVNRKQFMEQMGYINNCVDAYTGKRGKLKITAFRKTSQGNVPIRTEKSRNWDLD
jgi:hypothetical protein